MSINIQTADGLKEVGKVTKKKILKALGFTPADVQDLFSGDFNDLENNPIMASDEDTEFAIVDKNGNIILKVDVDGVHTPDVYLKDVGKISEVLSTKELPNIEDDEGAVLYVIDINGNIVAKIDEYGFHSIALSYRDASEDIDVKAKFAETQGNIDSHVDNTEVHVTSEDKTKWNNKSEFDGKYDSLMNPPELPDISNDETNTLYVVDNNGNIIASIDNSGFHTTDIYLENLGNIRGFIGNVSYNNGTEGLEYTELSDGTMSCTGIGTANATNIQIASIIDGKLVTTIGPSAFSRYSLTSVVIPDSITSIGERAFYSCSRLTNVAIGNSVTEIGEWAFAYCGLTSIKIPYGVISIGTSAFVYCKSLTSVAIPDSVTSIGKDAFLHCEKLTSVAIPDSVTSIGTRAFEYCKSLTSVAIPDSVTSIGYGAFNGCSALESITIPFVGAMEDDTNYTHFGSIFGAESYSSHVDYVPTSLKEVVITGGTSIAGNAFYDCRRLRAIYIANSITSIGQSAFNKCASLDNVRLGDSITSIGAYAFNTCVNLKVISIPYSITTIESSIFLNSAVKIIKYDGPVSGFQSLLTKNSAILNGATSDAFVYCLDGKIAQDGTVTEY